MSPSSLPSTSKAVTAFLNSKRSGGCSAKTLEKYEYSLGKLEAAFPDALPVELDQLEEYFAGLRSNPKIGVTTFHDVFHWTKQFYAFARGRYGIVDPFAVDPRLGGLQRPPLKRVDVPSFSKEEVFRLLARNQAFPEAVAAISFMLDTAARPGEAYSLKRENIHGSYAITYGKMGEERVPLSRKSREALLRWMMIHPGPGLWRQKTLRGFESMLRRAFARAGVKGFPYMLRHTAATLLHENGAQDIDVQRLMRHRTMRMTERYVQQSLARVSEVQRRYGALADWEESYQGVFNLASGDTLTESD